MSKYQRRFVWSCRKCGDVWVYQTETNDRAVKDEHKSTICVKCAKQIGRRMLAGMPRRTMRQVAIQ